MSPPPEIGSISFIEGGGETAGAVAQRRLRILQALAEGTRNASTAADVFRAASRALSSEPEVAFALFYIVDEGAGQATLAGTVGCDPGHPAAPMFHPLDDSAGGWRLGRVARTGKALVLSAEEAGFGPLPAGREATPLGQAVVLPLRVCGDTVTEAALVAGLPAQRSQDEGNDQFLELFAAQMSLAIGSTRPAELQARLQQRDEELRRERQTRARAEADSRGKDEFIAVVSHELRAPLGSILIWTQLLSSESPDKATLERALVMIDRSTRTLTKHIDDLLDASRIIAGKLQLEKATVEMTRVVEAAVEGERPAATAKGLSIELDVDSSSVRVAGDFRRLQQVVVNLLSNAVKFTPEGGRLKVRLGRRGSQAEIEVSDSGLGISPEFLPHIFERFRQANTDRPQTGLGLGLSIARHLVDLHGGSIAASSAGANQGSTFVVRVPILEEGTGQTQAGAPDNRVYARPQLSEVRILLVDDEEDAREAMAVLLRHAGAHVRSAGSAAEAMAAIEEERFDVILSDIAMPVEDGYVLIRRIRQHPHSASLPTVALTAYATIEDRGKALRAGYDRHMAKPVDPTDLISTVATLYRQRRRPTEA